MVAPSSGSSSLKEYLKRYQSNDDEEQKKKKKKKKSKTKPTMNGLVVVDEDPVWQKPVQIEEEEDDESQDEEKPQVDEDIEVKRMKRLEQIKARRPFGSISEDGSGWVSVAKNSNAYDSNRDISPPRKHKEARSDITDMSSPRHERDPSTSVVDSDMSPPRKRRVRCDTPSPEPNADDMSPPPRRDDTDISPPRKQRARFDTPSPERNSDPDLSPPPRRRSQHRAGPRASAVDPDLSPPRKRRDDTDRHRQSVSASDLSPPMKESDRPKTGLVSGKDIKEEITKAKKEDWLRFQKMDPSISGRNAEGIRRDKKTGARLTKEQIEALQKKDEKPKEIKLEWGKGLAQKREAEARQKELELEKAKPFARTRDDHDLNDIQKNAIRWGDPMAHLVKKKQSEVFLPDIGDNEKMKESGFIVPQQIPNHSWLKRGLDAAPNRYGIKPGRHWDGVDRSNGFEKQMFNRQNEKQAKEREAYLWSVADM
ncbi:hypothetical protein HanRHA438_Chr16g0738641 [Helianthus annuus]|uniref:BUD13 homolog n=2 Tax=Helianthus annuus TaxID=4232 RepID=A0A9K3GW70_HELAN|nr:BUD13 homolog [Helianthus annuus]XP_022018492.1 BUD13 homolog [Helianthus annuus]XP_035841895.1 BUD13 homolog [Helianthus annuus]KAF5758157.1 hypothetical protein HanXRQr2_Chr16g0726111 [Helianthus annuus]KAJ0639370.1 hypothetical protein HanLR1_Chr16g0603171 [Helianthus annuus]KAJ0643356.1 hypothetical protein HanOQP8_Chr16g0599681 [Helianthus annuus]KAJ0819452.1 hypothetical protein HanPSC8_Chr16g0696251 [Helianthus annuus]KAJ0833981.1 hypothetical protein HanRHA438_Chr16g0738641 [Helia